MKKNDYIVTISHKALRRSGTIKANFDGKYDEALRQFMPEGVLCLHGRRVVDTYIDLARATDRVLAARQQDESVDGALVVLHTLRNMARTRPNHRWSVQAPTT